jgi:hypothetical protein
MYDIDKNLHHHTERAPERRCDVHIRLSFCQCIVNTGSTSVVSHLEPESQSFAAAWEAWVRDTGSDFVV